jgi:hypothetical protein
VKAIKDRENERDRMSEDKEKKKDKWEFEDYAFTFTGILVGVLLIVPEILYSQFGISILGGTLGDIAPDLYDDIPDSIINLLDTG